MADANTPRPKEWLNAHNAAWVKASLHKAKDTMIQFDAHDFALVLDKAKKSSGEGETFRYLLRVKSKAIAELVVAQMAKNRNAA